MSELLPPSAGVIGWPVAHSKSPLIHRFWLDILRLDGDYGRFPVEVERLGQAIRAIPALGLRGVNVTVPHKEATLDHVDEVTREAQVIGAANTIINRDGLLVGANTDWIGVQFALHGRPLPRHAVVIGAGGAARAAVYALGKMGIETISVMNRSQDRAERMLADLGVPADVIPLGALPEADLLINASVLGMAGQPSLEADLTPLAPDGTVFDMVYAPLETELLRHAAERGLYCIDGLAMLIGQATAAFELFFGHPAPRDHDSELRALLAR